MESDQPLQSTDQTDVPPFEGSLGSRAKSSLPRPISPLSSFSQNPLHPATAVTPVKFASTTTAFQLAVSPTSSSSSGREGQLSTLLMSNERSPPQAGSSRRRLRRRSMLSLSHPANSGDDNMNGSRVDTDDDLDTMGMGPSSSTSPNISPTNTRSPSNPFGPGQSRWTNGTSPLFGATASPSIQPFRQNAPPSLQSLRTHSPPSMSADMDQSDIGDVETLMDDGDLEDMRSPLRFLPSHLQTSASRRKGKGKSDETESPSPATARAVNGPSSVQSADTGPGGLAAFQRKPLPATLLATLISETAPQEHEMQSEARMQRYLHSHASRLPFTPRTSKSDRGRFPEMADNEDDESGLPARRTSYRDRHSWTNLLMDSDSDSGEEGDGAEPVNAAFAAGMDFDRPTSMSSSSSSAMWPSGNVSDSGKMTPGSGSRSGSGTLANAPQGPAHGQGSGSASGSGTGVPTPPPQNGPWGSRPARMSFGNNMMSSPGTGLALPGAFGSLAMGGCTPLGSPTLERLELGASPGANAASSPGLMQYRESSAGSASMRPGKRKAQPDDRFDPYKRPRGTSPSLAPMSPSRPLSSMPIPSSPFATSNTNRRPYRPLSSRSRQASPALSIGSTSGVLSTSLGTNNSKTLGGNFIPTGPAATLAAQQGQAPQLGGLGLLSLANVGEDVEGEVREDQGSHGGRRRSDNDMEED